MARDIVADPVVRAEMETIYVGLLSSSKRGTPALGYSFRVERHSPAHALDDVGVAAAS